jgi:transcriptional regulator with XRE-family HTH domain
MGLRELRQAKGYTLKGLAEKSGVNYMKIHQIEVGKIKPENIALKNAVKLANALDCDPREILK